MPTLSRPFHTSEITVATSTNGPDQRKPGGIQEVRCRPALPCGSMGCSPQGKGPPSTQSRHSWRKRRAEQNA